MKNCKFSKVIVMILSLALLVGSVFAVATSASESESVEILSQNIAYTDNLTVLYAVNATLEDAIAGNVKVSYYWEDDGVSGLKSAKLLYPYDESGDIITDYVYNRDNVNYPVFYTEGVPAKDLGRVAYVTAYTGEAAPADADYKTYSVAQYLYSRLYKSGIVNATEGKDLLRKNTYENLLAYGAAAQELLINADAAEADKVVLVTDYAYAYTDVEGVSINGENFAIGKGSVEITLTYVGEGTLAGWTVTALDGAETEYDASTLTVSGVVKVKPIFGGHDCADVTPADHLCDICGETLSECADTDNDHLCNTCGETVSACADSNSDHVCDICAAIPTDGKCSVCGVYVFYENKVASNDRITITNIAVKSSSDYNTTDYAEYGASRPSGYTAGTFLSIKADPVDAANYVLASNTASGSGLSDEIISDVIFTPETVVAGGDLVVLEFDYYVDGGESGKNTLKFTYNYADGTTTRSNATYTSTADSVAYVRLIADADGSMKWTYDKWVRVRLVCDDTNDKIYTYLSTDNGTTYALCETVSAYTTAGVDIASLGFTFIGWGVNSTQYYDDIVCVRTDAATYGITFE